jgi:hypothetical protein
MKDGFGRKGTTASADFWRLITHHGDREAYLSR